MKIKITSCKNSRLWYNSLLDQEFDVVKLGHDFVWVREPDEYACLNYVMNVDYIVVD